MARIFLLSLLTFFTSFISAQNKVDIDVLSPKPSITIDGVHCNIGNTIYSCVPKTCNTVVIYEGDSIEFCTSTEIDLMIDSAYYMQWNFSGCSNYPPSFTDSFPNQTPICYHPIWNVAGNYVIDIFYNGWLSAYPTSDCWGFGPSHWIINVTVMPALGIAHNNSNPFSVDIFPNPSNGIFNLTISKPKEVEEIFVTDMLGQKILSLKNENESVVDLSSFPTGIYFLNVKTKNEMLVKKIARE